MLKKLSFLMLAAVMIVGGYAHAAAKAAVEGTVQKIDKGSITLKVGSDEKTFTFDRGLRFTVNGKRPKELRVKPGDRATVTADKKNVAQKIDITPQAMSETSGSN
jgi:hypothetical protein